MAERTAGAGDHRHSARGDRDPPRDHQCVLGLREGVELSRAAGDEDRAGVVVETGGEVLVEHVGQYDSVGIHGGDGEEEHTLGKHDHVTNSVRQLRCARHPSRRSACSEEKTAPASEPDCAANSGR